MTLMKLSDGRRNPKDGSKAVCSGNIYLLETYA